MSARKVLVITGLEKAGGGSTLAIKIAELAGSFKIIDPSILVNPCKLQDVLYEKPRIRTLIIEEFTGSKREIERVKMLISDAINHSWFPNIIVVTNEISATRHISKDDRRFNIHYAMRS